MKSNIFFVSQACYFVFSLFCFVLLEHWWAPQTIFPVTCLVLVPYLSTTFPPSMAYIPTLPLLSQAVASGRSCLLTGQSSCYKEKSIKSISSKEVNPSSPLDPIRGFSFEIRLTNEGVPFIVTSINKCLNIEYYIIIPGTVNTYVRNGFFSCTVVCSVLQSSR